MISKFIHADFTDLEKKTKIEFLRNRINFLVRIICLSIIHVFIDAFIVVLVSCKVSRFIYQYSVDIKNVFLL